MDRSREGLIVRVSAQVLRARPLRPAWLAVGAALSLLLWTTLPVHAAEEQRDEILSGLRGAGWTCVEDATDLGGGIYDGTECRSADADPRDVDIVRIANVGSVGAQSGVLGSSAAPALAPWTPSLHAVAVQIFEFACPGSGPRVDALVASLDAGQDLDLPGPPCFFTGGRGGTFIGDEERVRTYLVSVVPSAALGASPEPSPAAAPTGAVPSAPPQQEVPGAAGEADGGLDSVPAFARAIPAPSAVVTDPSVVATSAILALVAVLLVPFPGILFNSSLESNYDEVRGWFRRSRRDRRDRQGRRGPVPEAATPTPAATSDPVDPVDPVEAVGEPSARRSFWSSPAGAVAFLLLSAGMYGFLDPGFGSGPSTIPMYVGTVIGLSAVTMLAFAGPWRAHARLGERGSLRALPGTLLVAAVCVLISRLTGFLPGYLYGLLIALEFSRSLGPGEGRVASMSAATLLGAAGVAWFVLGIMPAGATDPLRAIATTALASIVVAGLEGVVFGLVPLRFLPGAAVFTWNRTVWATLYGIGVFGFLHVLLDPAGGYLASSARTPLLTIVALLVGFGVVSVAFWGYFRFRPEPSAVGPS